MESRGTRRGRINTEQIVDHKDRVPNGSLDYHEGPELVESAKATTFPFPRWEITASGERKTPGRPFDHLSSPITTSPSRWPSPCTSRFSSGPFRKVILSKIYRRISFGIISRHFLFSMATRFVNGLPGVI